ncbi:MAG: hypothetical protein GC159_22580 [Phycisphaera sp.]|nr:hypothetical protein [Phycisphaera sp.]
MIKTEPMMNATNNNDLSAEHNGNTATLADVPAALAERLGCDETVLADLSDVRWELVVRIQDQIEDETYETAEKLDIAASRLLDYLMV